MISMLVSPGRRAVLGSVRSVKKGLILAMLTLCPMMAQDASATQIDWTGYGKYAAIQVNLNGYTYNGIGGEINWQWIGSTPTGYSSAFYAYCVDLLHSIQDPQTVAIRSTDVLTPPDPGVLAAGPFVQDAGKKAAWLFNNYAPVINAPGGTGTDAAALQVAIWEALYDTTANLSTGAFTLLNQATNAAVTSKAITYLTSLYSGHGGTYLTSSATWLDAPLGAGQDVIIAMPIPEPAAIILLGTGLLALARHRRSRRRKAASLTNPDPTA